MPNRHTEATYLDVCQLEVTRSGEPASFLELAVVRQIGLRNSPKDLPSLQDDSSVEEVGLHPYRHPYDNQHRGMCRALSQTKERSFGLIVEEGA